MLKLTVIIILFNNVLPLGNDENLDYDSISISGHPFECSDFFTLPEILEGTYWGSSVINHQRVKMETRGSNCISGTHFSFEYTQVDY